MSDISTLPKTELHLHLEGAAPPDFIRTLAAEKSVDLSGIFDDAGAYRWTDFAAFLRTYEAACTVLQGPEDFRRLTYAVLCEQAANDVIYTEHFLAPDLCADGDPGAWPDYLAAICEGAAEAKRDFGIEARFISTCIRHLGPERALQTAKTTVDSPHPRLTGFGMGGEERHLMPADFVGAFAVAQEAGLGLTCHAGEICGAAMVRATIEAIEVSRIGHGVRAIEDAGLVAELAARGIVLEVNPGSNIALGVFARWEDHAITALRDAGVRVTISTDDPPYFHTTMRREYQMLARHHGWRAQDFRRSNLWAVEAAFCEPELKIDLRARF